QQVYEADEVSPSYRIGGVTVQPKPGSFDLPPGVLSISYALAGKGQKSVEFHDDAIVKTVRHPGEFTEIVPGLALGEGASAAFTVKTDSGAPVPRMPTDIVVGGRKLSVIRLAGKNSLSYRLIFAP